MKKFIIHIFSALIASIICIFNAAAQINTNAKNATDSLNNKGIKLQEVEMAGILYENGKIYLVVLVLLTIFAGIIFYLVRLDKKLTRLEKNQ